MTSGAGGGGGQNESLSRVLPVEGNTRERVQSRCPSLLPLATPSEPRQRPGPPRRLNGLRPRVHRPDRGSDIRDDGDDGGGGSRSRGHRPGVVRTPSTLPRTYSATSTRHRPPDDEAGSDTGHKTSTRQDRSTNGPWQPSSLLRLTVAGAFFVVDIQLGP